MSFIYFLQAAGDGPIKIGVTSSAPGLRLKNLQTGCPWPIKLIGAIVGTPEQEKKIHGVLAHYRTNGEWFAPEPIVLAAVLTALAVGRPAPAAPRKNIKHDNAVSAAITVLGGPNVVARLVGEGQPAVSNWKKRGHFPPHTFVILNAALAARGHAVPASLWNMAEAS